MLENIPFRNDAVTIYLYSHDISNPPFISRFFKKAEGVFQPENENQVLNILKFCEERKMPLIPRGSATSGYGGVIPVKGGYVIDFTRMNRFEIDEENKLVVSEPGAVWWDIERELNKKGLTLRVYPTSAPSSTVGGWIAQNGYGVGSLRYGSIAENVIKLRVADFRGIKDTEDIAHYAGLEGTTGLITRAWIKVKEIEDLHYYAFHVDGKDALKYLKNGNHYSALFLTEEYIRMKNQVFDEEIPEKDTLVIATPEKMDGDESLGEEIWETRFYPMRIRRIGPGIIPAEVIVPDSKLPDYLGYLKKTGFGSEVWFIRGDYSSVLSFLPFDERRTDYGLKWRLSLKALKMAKRLGGRGYSTGLYLSKESQNLFNNFEALRIFKKEIDPYNILNPGKVFPEGMIPFLMRISEVFA